MNWASESPRARASELHRSNRLRAPSSRTCCVAAIINPTATTAMMMQYVVATHAGMDVVPSSSGTTTAAVNTSAATWARKSHSAAFGALNVRLDVGGDSVFMASSTIPNSRTVQTHASDNVGRNPVAANELVFKKRPFGRSGSRHCYVPFGLLNIGLILSYTIASQRALRIEESSYSDPIRTFRYVMFHAPLNIVELESVPLEI